VLPSGEQDSNTTGTNAAVAHQVVDKNLPWPS